VQFSNQASTRLPFSLSEEEKRGWCNRRREAYFPGFALNEILGGIKGIE
jgi:hypothetical protein